MCEYTVSSDLQVLPALRMLSEKRKLIEMIKNKAHKPLQKSNKAS